MPRSSGPAVLGGECFQRSKLFQKEVVELALPADDGVHELVTSMPSCHGMRRKQVQPAGLKDDLVVDFGGVHDELDAEAKGAAHDALEEVGRDVVFFFFFSFGVAVLVDGRAASVPCYHLTGGVEGDEVVFGSGEAVVDL